MLYGLFPLVGTSLACYKCTMSEEQQNACIGRMIKSRRDAKQAYQCWQQKMTEWGTTLSPLADALKAHPTPPEQDLSTHLETYPTKEEITESLAEIHRLYLEIKRLDELLKEFM